MNAEQTRMYPHPIAKKGWAQPLGVPTQPTSLNKTESTTDDNDSRPRRLSVEAIESNTLLSHAIEYLTDARQIPSGKITDLWPGEPDVQAIMLLMEARRSVYLACPVVERRSVLGLLGTFKGPERRRR